MTTSNEDTPGESSDGLIGEWISIERRPLLKALGVGSMLSASGGMAAAIDDGADGQEDGDAGDGSDGQGDGDAGSQQIDPLFGYSTTDPADIPEALAPDHEVKLHRAFPDNPKNPERPSLFHFEPSGLRVNAGDVVQFTFSNPNHTVTAYHPDHGWQRRVPEGIQAFSSPVVPKDGAWLYRFKQEGLYDLYCGPHSVYGMAMRIVVGDLSEGDIPDYENTFEAEGNLFAPTSPKLFERELNVNSDRNENAEWVWPTDREVLDTDVLDPRNIQKAGKVSFEEVTDELDIPFEHEVNKN